MYLEGLLINAMETKKYLLQNSVFLIKVKAYTKHNSKQIPACSSLTLLIN